MSDKTTIYDIAKKLNTTAATVSRALNNNPKISESTRKLVLETAKKMNYNPNRLALALKSGKSHHVGVVVPYINRNFFSSIIRGIEEELNPKGYHVIISQTHEDAQMEIDAINTLLNAQVDGILMSISKTTKNTDHFVPVLKKKKPLVLFDRTLELKGVSTVTINDFEGGYEATKHLIEQGCKRIAHISGDWSLNIYKERMEGYKQALRDHHIEIRDAYIIKSNSDIESGRRCTQKLLKLDERPDAIFSSGDFQALGAIQELRERGIKVPEEFCVVGFSNEPFTKFMELSITSVDQAPLEMGKMAATVFLEQVNSDQKTTIEKKVILTPELHIRHSSTKNMMVSKKVNKAV